MFPFKCIDRPKKGVSNPQNPPPGSATGFELIKDVFKGLHVQVSAGQSLQNGACLYNIACLLVKVFFGKYIKKINYLTNNSFIWYFGLGTVFGAVFMLLF